MLSSDMFIPEETVPSPDCASSAIVSSLFEFADCLVSILANLVQLHYNADCLVSILSI